MGGRWTSMNKLIPSAYINFRAKATPAMTIGERGIATMAMSLPWGPNGELIEIYATDLIDGTSRKKVGLSASDADSLKLRLMLSGAYKALIYRINEGGINAVNTAGNLTAKAKHAGTFGNSITITVMSQDGAFVVSTYVAGSMVDSQIVTTVQELNNNDFVEFSGNGALVVNAGITLEGGTDGTITASSAIESYIALAKQANWQVMAITSDLISPDASNSVNAQFAAFANQMRNDEGRGVQVVVANYDAADSISVINSDCGVTIEGVDVSAADATAWVAGITAGASVIDSNVGRVFSGATKITNVRTKTEIEEALRRGMFILSTNTSGEIAVVDDINSLRTFTTQLSEDFRLNQVIRVLDEIGTTLTHSWETMFKGKVQNNAEKRAVFKSVVDEYLKSLQSMGAIENYVVDHVTVEAGNSKDSVLLTIDEIDPTVAMSTLYGLVYVI